jgi:hypothetical protein
MAGFDLSNYEDVDTRIHRFWESHPNGRISTDIVYQGHNSEGQLKQVIIRARVWKDKTSGKPDAVDFAEELFGSSPVNRSSFIENCSTSAIGRALATLGMSKKGSRPSTTEMTKAARVVPKEVDPWALADEPEAIKESARPVCAHGHMERKTGLKKDGTPYAGWICGDKGASVRCEAIWDRS